MYANPATQVGTICFWKIYDLLSNDLVLKHKCDEDYLLPEVNSPRVSWC